MQGMNVVLAGGSGGLGAAVATMAYGKEKLKLIKSL